MDLSEFMNIILGGAAHDQAGLQLLALLAVGGQSVHEHQASSFGSSASSRASKSLDFTLLALS